MKTVELIEEQLPWVPRIPIDRDPNEIVLVRIGYEETDLRQVIKEAGARWQQERKLWQLPLGVAYAMGLDQRIVR